MVFYKAHGVRSSAPWQAATQSCPDNKCSFKKRKEPGRESAEGLRSGDEGRGYRGGPVGPETFFSCGGQARL